MFINVKDAPYNAQGNGTSIDSIAIANAIAAGSADPNGCTLYFPPGKYLIDRPIEVRKNVFLRGEYLTTILAAHSNFTNSFGRFMIRNWLDTDFPTYPSAPVPPTYPNSHLSAPPQSFNSSTAYRNYAPFIENFVLDFRDVAGVSGIGWVHMQEAGIMRNLVIMHPNGAIGIYLTRNNDPEGSINGGTIEKITFYLNDDGAHGQHPDGYIHHVKIANENGVGAVGSDIHISDLTTAPLPSQQSVFHFQGIIDLTLDNIHTEAYVKTTASGDYAIFRLINVSGFSLRDSFFSASVTTLMHPLLISTNINGLGYGVTSPCISNLQFYGAFGFHSSLPMIYDASQSNNVREIFRAAITRINYYDGGYLSLFKGDSGFTYSTIKSLTDQFHGNPSTVLDGSNPLIIPIAFGSGNRFAEVKVSGRNEQTGQPFICTLFLAVADNTAGYKPTYSQIVNQINAPGTLSLTQNPTTKKYQLNCVPSPSNNRGVNITGSILIHGDSNSGSV